MSPRGPEVSTRPPPRSVGHSAGFLPSAATTRPSSARRAVVALERCAYGRAVVVLYLSMTTLSDPGTARWTHSTGRSPDRVTSPPPDGSGDERGARVREGVAAGEVPG